MNLDDNITVMLTPAERNIIVASLELWQRSCDIPSEIYDIAAAHDKNRNRFLGKSAIVQLIETKLKSEPRSR